MTDGLRVTHLNNIFQERQSSNFPKAAIQNLIARGYFVTTRKSWVISWYNKTPYQSGSYNPPKVNQSSKGCDHNLTHISLPISKVDDKKSLNPETPLQLSVKEPLLSLFHQHFNKLTHRVWVPRSRKDNERSQPFVRYLHPGRSTAGTYKSPTWKGKWSEPNLQGIMFRTLIFRGVASRFFFHTKKGSSASCRSPCQCVRNKASQVVFFLRHLSTLPILVEEGFPGTLKRHGFRIFISSVGVQMDDSEILGDSAPVDIQKSSTQGGFLKLK